jgi:hypothetical protein
MSKAANKQKAVQLNNIDNDDDSFTFEETSSDFQDDISDIESGS